MKPSTEPAPKGGTKKPRLALFIATGFGLGYLPLAPGTWGSLLGILAACVTAMSWRIILSAAALMWTSPDPDALRKLLPFLPPTWLFGPIYLLLLPRQVLSALLLGIFIAPYLVVTLVIALVGVWTSKRAEAYLQTKDPQVVVIDEVSGQQLTLLLSPLWLNWKYLLLGFILFRVFDIWKPFPVRQAERLPGGWGIMADDWLAGIYAALGLWLARALGL